MEALSLLLEEHHDIVVRIGLTFGMVGAVLLGTSQRIGVKTKSGGYIYFNLDPMNESEENKKKVDGSHFRAKHFQPIGWILLIASFGFQLAATFA